jgi:hypothetical protein
MDRAAFRITALSRAPDRTTYTHPSNQITMHLDPILTELLRNNELPSESRLQETMQLRSGAHEDLLHIDTEIQHLMAKREQVQRSLDVYNTILSPARRLLPDVLQEIFYHCIGQTYPILSATEAPMLLTRVCSLWRSVALSSPRIWTRLHIPLPGDPKMYSRYGTFRMNDDQAGEIRRQMFSKMMQLRCRAVKDWLDRSGSLPLSLSISFPFGYESPTDNSDVEEDEVVDPLFHTIRPFAPRWRHLALSMPFYIYQKLETTIPLDNLSMLRYLKGNIHFHDATPIAPQPTPVPLHIIDLPALEGLSIYCMQLTMNLRHHPNSWDRLTDICFESPVSDTDLHGMLKQCHNLIALDVYIQIPWVRLEGLKPTLEMVFLPHLEILKLRESGPASSVISAINAPFVKSLQYICPQRYEHYDDLLDPPSLSIPESLIWLISNAAASLETLSINPRAFLLEHVLQCLQLAVHVKELIFGSDEPIFSYPVLEEDIHCETSNDWFNLEAFTVHTPEYGSSTHSSTPLQNDILLPNLESLEANGGYLIADKNLRKILTSRIDSAQRGLTTPLRRVKVQFARKKREDIGPEIVARARDAGVEMKLDLIYPPPGPNIAPLSPSFLLPDS